MTQSSGRRGALSDAARRTQGRPGPLAYHPQIGAVLFVIGLLIFGGMALNLFAHGPLLAWDKTAIEALHAQAQHGPAYLVSLMKVGSSIGYYGIMALLFGGALFFLVRRDWRGLSLLAAGVGGGEALFDLIAAIINRPRPNLAQPYEGLQSFSFPSGHTVSSTLLFGLLLYLYLPGLRRPLWRVLLILLGVFLVAWISFSRLYLGSHFPTDVIAGFGFGLAWGSLVYTALEVLWRRRWERAATQPVSGPPAADPQTRNTRAINR